ncbi:MAG TPA: hypothetical protein PLP18_07275 [Smithellaceae bacterium]|nr:hypothetical protein [Smithellaceae bacterium]
MTEATQQALIGLRDFSTVQWYIIPLLGIIMYVYAIEINKSLQTKNWDPIYIALTFFGLDFINETWNGWVMFLTGKSAFWTVPGETAFRIFIGWNIEIVFTFLLMGFVYYYALSPNRDKKILGLNERWAIAIGFCIFCVFIECLLNIGGKLVWHYPWWMLSFGGIWLIFFIGYLPFYAGCAIMAGLKTKKAKLTMLAVIYAVPIVMNILALGIWGWNY